MNKFYNHFKKIFVLTGITLIVSLNTASAFANYIESDVKLNEQLEIIHLGQTHQTGKSFIEEDPKQVENVVRSQYEIVKYIIKNPGIPVFYENYPEDADKYNCVPTSDPTQEKTRCDFGPLLFPNGLPLSFHLLNSDQKRVLFSLGAGSSLIVLGIRSKIYKTISKELYKELHSGRSLYETREKSFDKLSLDIKNMPDAAYKLFKQELRGIDISDKKGMEMLMKKFGVYNRAFDLLFGDIREKLTINYIESAIKNNPEEFSHKQVFLVYGDAHDFTEECQKHGYKSTKKSFDFGIEKASTSAPIKEKISSIFGDPEL
jgi:hypothetical protein